MMAVDILANAMRVLSTAQTRFFVPTHSVTSPTETGQRGATNSP